MLDVGEQLVSSYLRYIKGCNFIETNVYTGKSQGEIDVVGLNLAEQRVYICEVAIHLGGLQYVNFKNNQTDNIQRFTDKFSRNIEYARESLGEYDHHFMLWSPIAKDTKGKLENNQLRHLAEIEKNLKKRYDIDIECIVNEKFQACLKELRDYAAAQTVNLQCPLMRLMQIEEYLGKHVKKLTHIQGRESTPTSAGKLPEEGEVLVPPVLTALDDEVQFTGSQVKELREKVGLTQEALAVKLGMKPTSSAAISDWENGRVKVPAKHHAKLLALYNKLADT